MRSLVGGYTVLEVMIFLAISTVMLFAAITAVGGQSGTVEFQTSVNDLNTKLQQWVDQVANGESGNSSNSNSALANLVCTPSSTTPIRPAISAVSTGAGNQRGANPDCIFMGKTILFNNDPNNNNHVYAIPVVGLRNDSATGEPSGSIVSASPVAALNVGTSSVDLSDEYTIPSGTRVLWARNNNDPSSFSFMAGFFTSLNTSQATNNTGSGSLSLLSALYPYHVSVNSISDPSIASCIMLQSPCNNPAPPANLWPLTNWGICLASTRTNDYASLIVHSSNGYGFTTEVKFGKGSPVPTSCAS